MIVIGVIGPEPPAAIAALSRQLVPNDSYSESGFLCHHDSARDVLYVGLPWPCLDSGVVDPYQLKVQEASGLQAALLLFLTSHVLVWVQPPGAGPDAHTLGTLRLLQQSKQLLLPLLPDLLDSAADAGAGTAAGGACPPWSQPPLLLFVCQARPGMASVLTPQLQAQTQQQIDARLRLLIKQCRVLLPEDHPAALCTLRQQGTAWLLGTLGQSAAEAMQLAFAAVREGAPGAGAALGGATGPAGAPAPHASSSQATEGGGGEGGDAAMLGLLRSALHDHLASLAKAPAPTGATATSGGVSFLAWQRAFINLVGALQCAKAAGTAPSPAAGQQQQKQQQPGASAAGGELAAVQWISGCTSMVEQVSEARCQRAAAAAREAYLRAVPQVYPPATHTAALQGALRVYASLARGPACLEVEGRVRAECEALWRDGRQQCQARSVWGHPCTLPPHDPQEVPHSSGMVFRLAIPGGQQQVAVADPFPPPKGSNHLQQLALAAPIQPSPRNNPPTVVPTGIDSSPAASRVACIPLLVRREAAGPSTTAPSTAGSSPLPAGSCPEEVVPQLPPAQAAGLLPSGCFLEVHVLGPGKAAQGGIQHPGILPSGGSLHRFLLQVRRAGDEPSEEFPALAQAQPSSSKRTEPPRVANWPGGAVTSSAAGGAPLTPQGTGAPAAAASHSTSGPAGQGKKGKREAVGGRAGAAPAPAVMVGMEYESLFGHRVVVNPAQLAACTASSLDWVVVAGSTDQHSGGITAGTSGELQCPRTDALATAASESLGAAAAAAAAAKRAATAPSAVAGGPAAELMLSSTLPLYLHLSADQLGSTLAGRAKGGKGSRGGKAGVPAAAGHSPSAGPEASWWQLRRVFMVTPAATDLHFQVCPLLRLEFAGARLPAETLPPATQLIHQQHSQQAPASHTALTYQPQQAVRLPPDSLCCLTLPWIYTVPSSTASIPAAAAATLPAGSHAGSAPVGSAALAGGTRVALAPVGVDGEQGLRGGVPATAPLLLWAGPLLAELVGGTVLRPEAVP